MEKYINPYTDTKHLWDIANGMDAAEKKALQKEKKTIHRHGATDESRRRTA